MSRDLQHLYGKKKPGRLTKRPPTALPGCRDSGLQGCRAAGRGLTGAWLQRQAEGPEQLPELRATARGSSSERVNEKPPCIRMLIVKIVYYLRKVIWLLETPTKETSLCPFHLPGSVKDDELNSKFTCDEVTVIPQPAEHCCHAHRAESSTAFQLFLWNPGGTVTCYLLLLAFFFFPPHFLPQRYNWVILLPMARGYTVLLQRAALFPSSSVNVIFG